LRITLESNFDADSWIAVTPSSDDGNTHLRLPLPPVPLITPDLALAVEGLRIHEHEESFLSENEEDEDISLPSSADDSSVEDELGESSDEDTVLAPRTMASLGHPLSDEALRARYFPFTPCNPS
jgi:hypothetical protein